VVVENFRPGVMDRLGLGFEMLKQVNPQLVYCAISGCGQNGPSAILQPMIKSCKDFPEPCP